MIKFQCPECAKNYALESSYAGKKARCKCGAILRVPSASEQMHVSVLKSGRLHPPLQAESTQATSKGDGKVQGPSGSEQFKNPDTLGKLKPQHLVSKDQHNWQTASEVKGQSPPGVSAAPPPVPTESPNAAVKSGSDSDAAEEKARKTFRGQGRTVVILGLLSLLFIGEASEALVFVTFVGISLCVVTGVWLAIKPSVPIGVAAGISLSILGIIDLLLASGPGGLALVAPVIDFAFAVRVFVGCASYAKALTATEPATD